MGVQLNLVFLTFIDLHIHSQIVSDYHPLFSNGFFEFEIIIIFGCRCGPVFSRSSEKLLYEECVNLSRKEKLSQYQQLPQNKDHQPQQGLQYIQNPCSDQGSNTLGDD